VHGDGLAETAHAAKFMLIIRHDSISMAASASRRLRMDSSRQMGVCSAFAASMVIEIVVPKRLLNHQQVEGVEALGGPHP